MLVKRSLLMLCVDFLSVLSCFVQDTLLDRRLVYQHLQSQNILTPRHIVVSRDDLPEGGVDPEGERPTAAV